MSQPSNVFFDSNKPVSGQRGYLSQQGQEKWNALSFSKELKSSESLIDALKPLINSITGMKNVTKAEICDQALESINKVVEVAQADLVVKAKITPEMESELPKKTYTRPPAGRLTH